MGILISLIALAFTYAYFMMLSGVHDIIDGANKY